MPATLHETNFVLPDVDVVDIYHGKVADVYTVAHNIGLLTVNVRTDRVSAFDIVLPELIPYKGQVLNQMSAAMLDETAVPNWLIEAPDPNVSIGLRAEPFRVEMIVRSYLLGTAWRAYEQGLRDLCSIQLPEGMMEYQPLPTPYITPTTKAHTGHDANIAPRDIVASHLATAEEYDEMANLSLQLFAEGQRRAHERGLVLADTKYEFGRLPRTGQIVVIDEIHTPDSSRFFPAAEFNSFLTGQTSRQPLQLSKEFVRMWLRSQGFTGEPGQQLPSMPEEVQTQISARYVDLYKRMMGREFQPATEATEAELHDRIERNILIGLDNVSRYYS